MNLPPAATKTFTIGAPLALAIVELFHPHPSEREDFWNQHSSAKTAESDGGTWRFARRQMTTCSYWLPPTGGEIFAPYRRRPFPPFPGGRA
jgi:hypothetical protein